MQLLSINMDEIPAGMAAVAGLTIAKLGALYYLHKYGQRTWVWSGKISKLFIYPLKSCRGIEVNELKVTAVGSKYGAVVDRHWMIVFKDGHQATQRNAGFESLALVTQSVQGDKLLIEAPGMETLELDTNPPFEKEKVREVSLFGKKVEALDCGEEAHRWICKYVDRDDIYIVYLASELDRVELTQFNKPHNFYARPGDVKALHDESPFMVMTKSTLDDVAERIPDKNINVNRFRPNIVVDGCEPYVEDEWSRLQIGDTNFFSRIATCTRCILTTVDQDNPNQANDKLEPLTTLRKYRMAPEHCGYGRSPALGVHFCPDNIDGTIRVGDDVFAVKDFVY